MELVFVADDDAQLVESTLLFVELHAKGSNVHLAVVPIRIEFLLEDLACLDIERAPTSLEMLKDLDGGGVAIGSIDVLEL